MSFEEVLKEVRELLEREGRVAYRILKRRFALEDEDLEDLKADLIDAKQVARDEDGRVLVWTGSTGQLTTPQMRDAGLRARGALQPEAERRQLTVMFCDMVGSTALSEQLDPEELREVVRAYQQLCATMIDRFAGHLAKYIGDGLLAYFGYPVAHEDDASRAVRTGLGIAGAIAELPLPPNVRLPYSLQVRIGIHTGLVVAGEMGTVDQPEHLAIVGETPNLAARLQEKAAPNSVVISATTYRLVTGLFECQELGPQTLKGISLPVLAYQVVQESEAQSRFDVAMQAGLTPLVGRDHEVGLLRDRWAQATGGAGQVVLLSGEPGIGKSRLVQVIKEQLTAEGATRIEFRCSSYYQNSALYPVIEHLQRLLQFDRTDSPQRKLEKLEQVLARYHFPQAETLPLLAALLSLPHPEACPPLLLSPQKQKEQTQETLVTWVVEEAERAAVYLVWEDLQWADPSSLELIGVLLDQAPTMPMLALLTSRPEFIPSWTARAHLTPLILPRLPHTQGTVMVEKLTGGKTLPPEVVQQIVAKTDGVPLFVEELTKMVLESGLVREHERHYELTGPLPSLAIPATLHDSLMARLDRLSPVREVAQLGATLGREFSYELLHAISPLDETTLQRELSQLVDAELLYQHGLLPQARYLFKHALIQDTAYQSLLKSKRLQLHQRVAHVLEERFPETKDTQPELLAHHYTEAGLIEHALPYWLQAGQTAVQRSAHVEAIRHLTGALALLKTLPDTPERLQQELTLQMALGAPLLATKGYAAPEVERTYARARELCRQIGDTSQLFPVLFGLWVFYYVQGALPTARELVEECFTLAQSTQDSGLLVEAHIAFAATLFHQGEFPVALAHVEQGLTLYDPQQHGAHIFQYGQDPAVASEVYAALILWQVGYPDQALKRVHQALTRAEQLGHPFSMAFALLFATWSHQYRREVQRTQERAAATMTLCGEQRFSFWLTFATVLGGWPLAEQGQGEAGIMQIRHGLAGYQATGAQLNRPYFLALLAEAYGKTGRHTEGLTVVA